MFSKSVEESHSVLLPSQVWHEFEVRRLTIGHVTGHVTGASEALIGKSSCSCVMFHNIVVYICSDHFLIISNKNIAMFCNI